jgi:hypothetical protein
MLLDALGRHQTASNMAHLLHNNALLVSALTNKLSLVSDNNSFVITSRLVSELQPFCFLNSNRISCALPETSYLGTQPAGSIGTATDLSAGDAGSILAHAQDTE